MKKIKMKRILFLLGLFIGLNSCYKGDSKDNLMDSAIFEAKEFFENQFDPNDETLKNNSDLGHGNSKRHTLEKNLDWPRAYTKEFEDGRIGVYVPVLYSDDNYYIKAKWASLSLSGLTYALIYEKEQGKKSVEIVTTFPDSKYLSSEEKPEIFSGTVYVEDWNGKFIKSVWYTNGEVFLLEANKKEKRSAIKEICEGSIDWYTCSYREGDAYADCNYNYTEYYTYVCSGVSIGGGGSYYIPSSGGTPIDIAEDCNCNICPVCGGCLDEVIMKRVPLDDGTATGGDATPDCPACSCDSVEPLSNEEIKTVLCDAFNGMVNLELLKNNVQNFSPYQEQFIISLANVAAMNELGESLVGLQGDLRNFPIENILYSKYNILDNHELYTEGWDDAYNLSTNTFDALLSPEIGNSNFQLKFYFEKMGESNVLGIVKEGFLDHSVEAALEFIDGLLRDNQNIADDFIYDMHFFNALNYMEGYCNE